MAKRRSETGKTGKHQHGELDYSYDYSRGRSDRRLLIILIMSFIIVVIGAVGYGIFIWDTGEESEKDDVNLMTDSPSQGGYPLDVITFDYTVHNPDKEPDIFSPMISGLPSAWNITIPTTISVEAGDFKEEEFTISIRTDAINKSYPFKLEVTSANTQRTYSLDFEVVIYHAFYGIEMIAYNNSNDAEPGNSTNYGLIITNLGNGDDTISLSYVNNHLPAGWTITFEQDSIEVPLFDTRVVIVNITTSPATTKGRYDIRVIATSSGGPAASIWLNTSLVKDFGNRTIEVGDKVMVDYIGYFVDGAIFDTSVEEVAKNDNFTREDNVLIKTSFSPLGMYVGGTDPDTSDAYGRMYDGFWEAAVGMKLNETKVMRLSPEKANRDGLWRIFELTIVSIDS